jgi:hypothetical protein
MAFSLIPKKITHAHTSCHLAMALFATVLCDMKSLNVTTGKIKYQIDRIV